MPQFQALSPKTVHATNGYSQAVRMGDMVFLSGQIALNASGELVGDGDVREQTEQVFRNMELVLDAAGSGMDRVGMITVLITDIEYRETVAEIRNRIFAPLGYQPASTLAVVKSLARPDFLVEIEAVAMVK